MKKILLSFALLTLLICGCKKSSPAPETTNIDINVTCQCTFNVQVQQRQNSTMKYWNVDNQTAVANKYEIKLNGSKDDLISVTITNASQPPYVVNIEYHGVSIFYDSSQLDTNGTANVYVPY